MKERVVKAASLSCISVNEEASHFVRGDLLLVEMEKKPRKKRCPLRRFLRGFFVQPPMLVVLKEERSDV